MIDPASFAPVEELGRRVSSSSVRKPARNGNVPISVFVRKCKLPGRYVRKLSTDRLHPEELSEVTAIAVEYDKGRDGGRTFYGWAAVSQDAASRNGRRLEPSPQPDNPYHADIILPSAVTSDKKRAEQLASELAAVSRWQDRVPLQST